MQLIKTKEVHRVIRVNSLSQSLKNYTDVEDLADRIAEWLDDHIDDEEEITFDIEVDADTSFPHAYYDETEDSFVLSLPLTDVRLSEFSIAYAIVSDLDEFLIPETGSYEHTSFRFVKGPLPVSGV
jgi:hypothetical protein